MQKIFVLGFIADETWSVSAKISKKIVINYASTMLGVIHCQMHIRHRSQRSFGAGCMYFLLQETCYCAVVSASIKLCLICSELHSANVLLKLYVNDMFCEHI